MSLRRLLALVLLAVAGVARAQGASLNVITAVGVKDEGRTVVLSVQGSKPPNFTTFSMADPPRFVVDFSEARFQGVPEDVSVNDGTILLVKNLSYGSDATSIARIMVAFAKDVDPPEVVATGNALVVRIAKPSVGAPLVAQVDDTARRERAEAEARARAEAEAQARVEAERRAREVAAAEALAQAEREARAAEVAAAEARARAEADRKAEEEAARVAAAAARQAADAELAAQQKARTDAEARARAEAERQAKTAAEAERQAERNATALAAEERRAAEAEGERQRQEAAAVARAEAERQQREAAERREAERLARETERREQAEAARLAREEEQRQRAEAARLARETEAQRREEEQRQRAEAARLAREAELQRREEERLALAAARDEAQRAREGEAQLAVPAPAAQLREIGFRQLPGVSRVFVRTSATPRFVIHDVGENTVRIELENTRVATRNDTRHLDTSFFPSAVALIAPSKRGSTYVVDIKLKQRVPYQQRIEGDVLAIDFERPGAPAGADAPVPELDAAPEAAPAPVGADAAN